MKSLDQQDLRYQPLYPLWEVSRYTRVKPATLRTWARDKEAAVIVPPKKGPGGELFSFINLIEVHVLEGLRRTHHVPLQRIRKAIKWLEDKYNTKHPLAELNLETDGYNLFVRELNIPINASQQGQGGFPEVLARYLHRIERDHYAKPVRFYPYTYEGAPKIIVMDPNVAFGRPVIKGTRVSSQMVFDRYSGGESIADIASDYDLQESYIEEALRCEIERSAA